MNSRKSGGSTRDVGLVKAHGCVNPVYPQPIGVHCEGIVRNRLYFHGQAHDAFVNSLVPADRLSLPMPIIDVTLVLPRGAVVPTDATHQLANALGVALNAAPGHVWVRLHALNADNYAENESRMDEAELPVFVTVLHAHWPTPELMSKEVEDLVAAVATCLGRPPERVHIEYAFAGAGRWHLAANLLTSLGRLRARCGCS
jgi:hypothetical protein